MTPRRRKTQKGKKGQHVAPKELLPRGPHVVMGDGSVAVPPGRAIDFKPWRPLETNSIRLAVERRTNEAWRARHTAREVEIEDAIADKWFTDNLEYDARLAAWNEEQHAIAVWKREHPRHSSIFGD